MREQTNKILKTLCIYMLVISMMLSNLVGSLDVMAAGVPAPTIDKVFYDATTISGAGVHRARVNKKTVRGIIHVTLKNGDTVKASSTINPTSTKWTYKLPEGVSVAEGDVVTAYQEFDGNHSDTVTASAEPSMAYNHKNDLKMPSGEIWIEHPDANLVNNDEQSEAVKMLKDANPAIVKDIKSVKFTIDSTAHAYYEVTYTDGSISKKIEATGLKIKQVTETSAAPTIEKVQVTDGQIVVTLQNEVTEGTKFYFIKNFTDGEDKKFCQNGNCKLDKSNQQDISESISIDGKKVTFQVNDDDLELEREFGIIVKEPHKFLSCAKSEPVITTPDKVAVKDPKKITKEEKEAIADAIRKANTTPSGVSKLPNGTGYVDGMPAIIEVSDDGKVKIINPVNVEGTWDETYTKFTPKTNEDGTVIVSAGNEDKTITFDKPEELVKNLPPDTPKMENKDGNVVITPNIKVDTDAKKVIVEYEAKDGSKKTAIAEKVEDTSGAEPKKVWKVTEGPITVDESGTVKLPTKEVKTGTKVLASVEDNGGLVPEEKALDSGKAELLIENKYKVTYDANGGSGTMAEEEVNAGSKHRIKDNGFTAPKYKEFDKWMIGYEPRKSGEDIEVNNDIVIKAIWKFIINPKVDKITTTVNHPINYEMYKNAISGYPDGVTVEHIEVNTKPDISKIGGSKAEIEVRFSDGQFRKLTVPIEILKDPKDTEIEKLKKDIESLNKQITDLNNTITEKDGKITELNGKITELEGKLQECKNQCAIDKAECEKAKEALNKQIQDLTVEKTRLETLVHDYDELIKELRAHKETLNKQITDLKETVKGKDAEIAKLLEKIGGLETKIETLTTENTDLKEKLATATEKITGLEKELAAEKEKNKTLTDQVEKLNKDIETKTAEIKTLTDKVANLEKQLAVKNKESEADKAEIKRLKQELADLKKQLESKNTDVDKLNKEIVTLKETIKTLEGEKTELTNNVTRLEKEVTTLKETIKTSTEKITELEKENAGLKADNKNLTDKVTELTEKVKKAEDENTTLKAKIDELNAKIAELSKTQCDPEEINKLKQDKAALEATVKGKDELIQELRNQIADLKKSINDKDTLIREYKEEIEKLEAKVNELTTENTNLKEQLATATEKITNLETQLAGEKDKNKKLDEQNKALKQEKENLTKEKEEINKKLTQAESEKTQLTNEKANLQKELDELKKKLDACPADATDQINKLKDEIKQKENQITDKDTQIAGLNTRLNELYSQLSAANKQIVELIEKLNNVPSQPREKEYIYVRDSYTPSYNGDVSSLNLEIESLRRENRELKDKIAKLSQGQDCSLMAKERFVTIFSLKSMLYKTYLGDELMTQAEMMDLKGFIEPFISNNRTMLPLRYVALSLGLDVDWNHSTRTATFTNRDSGNALNPGKITINANTLEMKDQYGNNIAVDSKPMLKNGRFYISITNLTKAFGGTNGNLADGVRNTIEWDSQGRRVLVYKYSK